MVGGCEREKCLYISGRVSPTPAPLFRNVPGQPAWRHEGNLFALITIAKILPSARIKKKAKQVDGRKSNPKIFFVCTAWRRVRITSPSSSVDWKFVCSWVASLIHLFVWCCRSKFQFSRSKNVNFSLYVPAIQPCALLSRYKHQHSKMITAFCVGVKISFSLIFPRFHVYTVRRVFSYAQQHQSGRKSISIFSAFHPWALLIDFYLRNSAKRKFLLWQLSLDSNDESSENDYVCLWLSSSAGRLTWL